MKHIIKIIYLVIAVSFCFCSRPLPEKEPENNIRKQAMKLEPGQIVSGSYYSTEGTDIDYLYISVTNPAMIQGNLSAVKGIDPEILFFKKGEINPYKIANDNKSSLNERFGPFLIEAPGVVIAIRSISPSNDAKFKNLKYEFSYEITSAPLPVESESNDTLEEANILSENLIHGYYNNALNNNELERDYYRLDFPDEKKYRLGLSLSGVRNIDTVLRLYSENNEIIMMVDDGGVGEGEDIFSYGIQGPTKIFISVNAKDYKISESEFYEIKTSLDEYEDKFELEPNDNVFEANTIKTEKIFSDFSNEQDVDFYKFFNETLESRRFFAEVIPDSKYDIRMELYPGANSRPVIFDDGGDEISEGIANWTIHPLETVYIKVSKSSPGKTRSYTLVTEINTISEEYEKESNDTVKKATALFSNRPVMGFINPKTDLDYYVIRISNQARYQINLESPPDCVITASILDTKGIKTEGKTASQTGEDLSFYTILEPNGYILTSCENMKKPQFRDSYRLNIIPGE